MTMLSALHRKLYIDDTRGLLPNDGYGIAAVYVCYNCRERGLAIPISAHYTIPEADSWIDNIPEQELRRRVNVAIENLDPREEG